MDGWMDGIVFCRRIIPYVEMRMTYLLNLLLEIN